MRRPASFLIAALILFSIVETSDVGCAADAPERSLKICVSASAAPIVRQAAQHVLAAAASQPLLAVMSGPNPPTALTDASALLSGPLPNRAYSHLVVIGLMSDPAIQDVWQRQAKTIDNGAGLYIFGYGNLDGDVGYVESGRNPYLHSMAVKIAPFETQVVTITGTSPAGVAMAVNAFLHQGLVNGVVAAAGWKRPSTTILDRDPLDAGFALPSWIPVQAGTMRDVGVTQPGEDEYRGVLADTGVEPMAIWRVKYYSPGAWDGVGDKAALVNFANGLQRLSYGNTLWCAQFASTAEAKAATPKVAAAARLRLGDSGAWKGEQPPYAYGPSAGPLTLWQSGAWVFMSTLPDAATEAARAEIRVGR
jgi:hypothetical protein